MSNNTNKTAQALLKAVQIDLGRQALQGRLHRSKLAIRALQIVRQDRKVSNLNK